MLILTVYGLHFSKHVTSNLVHTTSIFITHSS